MEPIDFTKNAPGILVPTVEGCHGFCPTPLPPSIDWPRIVPVLSRADRALSQLDGMTRTLINPMLIVQPFQRREAIISSRIEGTYATDEEIVLFKADPRKSPRTDVREVMNYVNTLEYGLNRINELPISLRLLRELHRELLGGVRGHGETLGEFRTVQNFIGSQGQSIRDARFVPAPATEMTDALNEFEKFTANPDSRFPALVLAALIHYQFETIHPFRDGNGRLGRLLITLWLCANKYLTRPVLYMSAYFEKTKEAYYDGLLHVSKRGAWEDWVVYFLNGVIEQSGDAMERTETLLALLADYKRQLHSARSSALTLKLVEDLFVQPGTSTTLTSRLLGITPFAAQRHIDRLIALGVLQEVTGRKRDRFYIAKQILEITRA